MIVPVATDYGEEMIRYVHNVYMGRDQETELKV